MLSFFTKVNEIKNDIPSAIVATGVVVIAMLILAGLGTVDGGIASEINQSIGAL